MKERLIQKRISRAAGITYFMYIPADVTERTPLFVTVHGWSRNAREHARRFLPFAQRYGVVLAAPLFDVKTTPKYQQLVSDRVHERADRVLETLIEEIGALSGINISTFRLFGYSGGGQFAHRYTMAHPQRVSKLGLGAPGWYTFPDPAQRFPRGIGPIGSLSDISFEPWRFLEIPARVFIGELDINQDHHFNASRSICRLQGVNRMERARRWVEAMNAAARACRLSTKYSIELLSDSDHSFGHCMRRGNMGETVFRFLFGEPPPLYLNPVLVKG
jgi:pimeloyl-ACP methyl ester carboxylesterase